MLSKITQRCRLLCPLSTSAFTNSLARPATTHFGFQNVDEEEKQKKVNHVFESVAEKYDLMNDAMSLGVHRLWKDCFVRQIMPTENLRCLDVAGGTGDIAFRLSKFAKPVNDANVKTLAIHSGPQITLCDINASMMEVGKLRAAKLGLKNSRAYDVYSMQVIPVMGQLIAGDWNSYQYLVESIRRFPDQEEFSNMIRNAGFSSVNVRNFSGGIAAVHSGFKHPKVTPPNEQT
ncbi:Ubiquinone/menaquinone biosynthesis methyltransferase ubiE [Fasciolopsis buskii]|uniref:Ubiquinone/menaquinone biosynthesis methyltransferase ubiE n=1 Tax=Fasciolopsis buskii TaxID=27845 RepID=A0A8E0RJY4_9TREM|nr:Ubiquinone/menaquinone biosynthesis methyltransferase ubiE [Fasciolopsis buski]